MECSSVSLQDVGLCSTQTWLSMVWMLNTENTHYSRGIKTTMNFSYALFVEETMISLNELSVYERIGII
jgi:hypothetical protein